MNFGLRGQESDQDQSFSRDLAARLQLPFLTKTVSAQERGLRVGEGVQEWARRLRYQEFADLAKRGWAIALGHHQDDVAENALLRLARGHPPDQLAGMVPYRPPFWRPLLGESRRRIAAFAREQGISYREDHSNASDVYARNRIRHQVLPVLEELYPGATARIAATAGDISAIAQWCGAESMRPDQESQESRESAAVFTLDVCEIESLPSAIARMRIAAAIRGAGAQCPSPDWLNRCWQRMQGKDGTKWSHVLASREGQAPVQATVHDGHLSLAPCTPADLPASQHLSAGKNAEFEVLLGDGAKAQLKTPSGIWQIDATPLGSGQFRGYNVESRRRIDRATGGDVRALVGSDASHRVLIEKDGVAVGVMDGDVVHSLSPDGQGGQRRAGQTATWERSR